MVKQRGGAPLLKTEHYKHISQMSELLPIGMAITNSVDIEVLKICNNIVSKALSGSIPSSYEMSYLRDIFGKECTATDMKHLYLWINLSLLGFKPQIF